jgi:hypothetical protein
LYRTQERGEAQADEKGDEQEGFAAAEAGTAGAAILRFGPEERLGERGAKRRTARRHGPL